MTDELTAAKTYTDFQGLSTLKRAAHNEDERALKEVAKQFEAVFLQMVLKSMRDAGKAFESGMLDSDQMDMYQGMFDQQLSLSLGDKGVGLADMIVKQLGGHDVTTPQSSHHRVLAHDHVQTPRNSQKVAAVDDAKKISAIENTLSTFESPADFIKQIWSDVKVAARQLNIDPKVLASQAALETGWGKFISKHEDGSSSFNLFNIKADDQWQKDKVSVTTTEYQKGVPFKQKDDFRSYNSFAESLHDYVNLLKNNTRYQTVLEKVGDMPKFVQALQDAGFATDPLYAKKIMSIMNSGVFAKL